MTDNPFETLLNRAPLGVYLVDADLRIQAVNPVALPVFGDLPGGVIGRDFDEIIHVLWEKDYADEVVRIFRRTLDTGESYCARERAEYRADRGATEYYEWRVDRLTLPDGRYGLVCYFRDISAQVQARLKIAESERGLQAELADAELLQGISLELVHQDDVDQLYSKIMDAAVAVMRSDFASLQMLYPERGEGGELRLLAFRGFNPQAAKFWEWVRADSESTCGVALRTGRRVMAPDVEQCDFMAGTQDLQTYLQTGIRAVQTTPLFSRGGTLVGMISTHWREPHQPTERDLRLLDILARQAADLIERKAGEEALRASEAKYRTLFESIDEGFCIVEVIFDTRDKPADYRFLEVNPAFERQTGLTAARGRTMRELAPDHEEHWFEMYGRIARTGQAARFELPAAKLHRWYEVFAWRYSGPEDRQVAVLFNDITARKNAEAALREDAQRKDEFMAMLAHELRNPLSAIALGADLLKRAKLDDPKARFAAPAIERQAKHLQRLADDMLDMARATYGKLTLQKERLELLAIAKAVAALGTQTQNSALIEVSGKPAWVEGDAARVQQIIGNLIENAVKYGGRKIQVRVSGDAHWGRVSVQDDGQGIAPGLLPELFKPFVQGAQPLDRAQGGLGLGLALVERLAALHGGNVAAHSEGPGKGSTFTVALPASSAAGAGAKQASSVPVPGKRRVLVVEDESDVREMLRVLLEGEGHEVSVADNGVEGVAKFDSFRPDVALVDIGLPGMDGYEVARQARSLPDGSRFKLIAITGYGQEKDRQRAHDAGFDLHVTKPVVYDQLARAFES
jgi:PAS domain S-box-containing protein